MLVSLYNVAPSTAAPAAQSRDRDGAPPGATPAEDGRGAVPRDRVTLSREAQARGASAEASAAPPADQAQGEKVQGERAQGDEAQAEKASGAAKGEQAPKAAGRGAGKLTAEQERQLTELQQRDTHVRQHEAAHMAAGGTLAGGASYSYQTGPDGKSYAVGGEVPISLRTGRTPDETIANARRVRAAALAPSDPSPADLSVAAAATSLELAAQAQKARTASKAYEKHGGKASKAALQEPASDTPAAAEEPAQAVTRAAA